MTHHHLHSAPADLADRIHIDAGKPEHHEAPAFLDPDPLLMDLAEITHRLDLETAGTIGHDELSALVRECRGDLSGAPRAALPELIERLARQRLTSLKTPLQA